MRDSYEEGGGMLARGASSRDTSMEVDRSAETVIILESDVINFE